MHYEHNQNNELKSVQYLSELLHIALKPNIRHCHEMGSVNSIVLLQISSNTTGAPVGSGFPSVTFPRSTPASSSSRAPASPDAGRGFSKTPAKFSGDTQAAGSTIRMSRSS